MVDAAFAEVVGAAVDADAELHMGHAERLQALLHSFFDFGTGFPTGFRNDFSGGKRLFFKTFALALQLLHTFVAAVEQRQLVCEIVAQTDEFVDGLDVVFLFQRIDEAEPFLHLLEPLRVVLHMVGLAFEFGGDVFEFNVGGVQTFGQFTGLWIAVGYVA